MSTPTYTYDRDTKGIDNDAIGAGYATGTVCTLASGQISDVWAMLTKANNAKALADALAECVAVMQRNITPKPDVGEDHPYSVLKRAEAALAKAEGRA